MQIWKGMVFMGQIYIWVLQFEEAASSEGCNYKIPEEKEEYMSMSLITVT